MSDIIADLESQTKSLMSSMDSNKKRELIIAVDECCNNPEVENLGISLLKKDAIHGVDPVWNQRRIRRNGSILYSVGGAIIRNDPHMDWGKPAKGVSFPDHHVLGWVLAILSRVDVILISENTRTDIHGLYRLLQNAVRPNLGPPAKLVCCFKKGKTDYATYCEDVSRKVIAAEFDYGCTIDRI